MYSESEGLFQINLLCKSYISTVARAEVVIAHDELNGFGETVSSKEFGFDNVSEMKLGYILVTVGDGVVTVGLQLTAVKLGAVMEGLAETLLKERLLTTGEQSATKLQSPISPEELNLQRNKSQLPAPKLRVIPVTIYLLLEMGATEPPQSIFAPPTVFAQVKYLEELNLPRNKS